MIRTFAVQGYRSLRDLILPLGQLTVVTGASGSGKSSVYRSLRLLADAAQNAVIASLAREGGVSSTFWAGPETRMSSCRMAPLRPARRRCRPSSLIPSQRRERSILNGLSAAQKSPRLGAGGFV